MIYPNAYLIKSGYIWLIYIHVQHYFGHGNIPLRMCSQQFGNMNLTTRTYQVGTIDLATGKDDLAN
jgi:hypothetical protein